MRAGIAIGIAALLASTSMALACGQERWPVKTAADRDAGLVRGYSVSTISAMGNISAPSNPNLRPDTRFAPTETQIVAVSGFMTVIKPEEDEDYHMIIVDPGNPGATMIV